MISRYGICKTANSNQETLENTMYRVANARSNFAAFFTEPYKFPE